MIINFKNLLNSDNKKRLVSNFLSLSVLRGLNFLIPLINLPYLIRTIGIDNFGLVNFALSLGIYFGAIIQYGFGVTATREIARHRDSPVQLETIYSVTITASLILAIFSSLLFILIVLSFDKLSSNFNLYLFTLAYVIFQNLFPIWFFQGMEKMKYITILSLGSSVLFLISLFVFVKDQSDFVFVPLLHAIASIITFIIAIGLIRKQFKVEFKKPSWQDLRIIYIDGRHAFITQFAPNLYNNSTVFLLGFFTNNSIVGIYSGATKVIDAFISIAYILSNTFFPYLSRNLSRHKSFQRIMLSVGLTLTFSILLSADWITRLLFSAENIEVAIYIKYLAICVLLLFVTMTYGTNYLMIIGKERIVKNIALITSIVFFIIALLFIPMMGIWGAIASVVGARATIALLQFGYFYKYKHYKKAT